MSQGKIVQYLTRQDRVDDLVTDLHDIYEQYQMSTSLNVQTYEKMVKEFNTQLALVDGVRETYMIPLIQTMYELLSMIGSPSRKVNRISLLSDSKSGDVIRQDSVAMVYEKAIQLLRANERKEKSKLTLLLNQARQNLWKEKEGQKAKDRIKREIIKQQKAFRNHQQQIDAGAELAHLYRDVLMSAKETMEQLILPELKAVHALLTALSLAENIKTQNTDQSPKPLPVVRIVNTEYQKHYLFVKSVFSYYNLVLEVYESSVVQELFAEKKITQDKIQHFMQLKDSMTKQVEQIRENVCFYA